MKNVSSPVAGEKKTVPADDKLSHNLDRIIMSVIGFLALFMLMMGLAVINKPGLMQTYLGGDVGSEIGTTLPQPTGLQCGFARQADFMYMMCKWSDHAVAYQEFDRFFVQLKSPALNQWDDYNSSEDPYFGYQSDVEAFIESLPESSDEAPSFDNLNPKGNYFVKTFNLNKYAIPTGYWYVRVYHEDINGALTPYQEEAFLLEAY